MPSVDRTVSQGATGVPLTFALQERDGRPVDLALATNVTFHVRPSDFSRGDSATPAEVVDLRGGVVRHFFTDQELAWPGFLLVEVTWMDGGTPSRPRSLPGNRYYVVEVIRRLSR